MAHTKVTKTGTQNTGTANTFSYSGSFDVFKASEVEVELDNVKLTFTTSTINDSASPREYTVDYSAKTIHVGGANLAGTNTVVIQPVTDMGAPTPRATYEPGSSVTSADLNNNQLQLMRKAMEYDEQKLSSRGGTMTGNLHLGKDIDITFEGDTDNAYETTLTVADPTSDKTITLPDTTGTVVTTGDTGTITATMLAANSVDSSELVNGSIDTSHIGDLQVTTAKIAADAVTGAKIADDSINSEHYVDGSIDTAHIADGQVTHVKLANNAVDGDNISDDSINSEHYVDGSIDTAHIADSQVTTAKIAADAITSAKIADGQVNSEHIANGGIDAIHLSADSVETAKIENSAVTTAKIADDAVTSAKLDTNIDIAGTLDVTGFATFDEDILAKDAAVFQHDVNIKADNKTFTIENAAGADKFTVDTDNGNTVISGNLTVNGTTTLANSSIGTAEIADDAITGAKIADDAVDSEHIVADSLDTEHYAPTSIDAAALASNAVTEAKITDANVTTDKIANSNVTLAKLANDLKQTSISNSDTQLPTSGAVVDYVAAQIAPLGGLEVIADEDNFPTSQPASGVVISISDAAGIVVNGSGVSTTARTVGNGSDNVTINNFPSSLYGETLASGVGLMVSSTGSSQTYNYHKILAAETDVKQLSDDINDFNARYRVANSAPSSSLDEGDLWWDKSTDKLKVYSGASSSWEEVASAGDFYINTISSYSGTGGNSATFNGSAYRFVLSNPGSSAQQHVVSINGVIQKPNSGTSQPSEGFVIDGSSIIFSNAPASGSDYFILTLGTTVSIGTPSDGTVTAAKIASGAVETAKIADGAVTEVKLGVSNSPTNGYFLSAQSGNTGGLTWAAVNTDLSNDSSPQLGGDLASNSNDILMADSDKIKLGSGGDTWCYHSGNHSYIDNYTGNIYIRNDGSNDDAEIHIMARNDEESIVCHDDGAVDLYYNGVKTFETVNQGIKISGPEGGSAFLYMYADEGDDNADQYMLKVEQDGTGFYIRNNVSGSTETNLRAVGNGGVELYHDNSKRIETKGAGANFYGDTGGVTNVTIYGSENRDANLELFADDGDDNADKWRILSSTDGSFYLQNYTSGSWEWNLKATGNDAVELYYDNTMRFKTGVGGDYGSVVAANGLNGWSGYSINNQWVFMGDSGSCGLYNDMDNEWFVYAARNGSVYLYHDGTTRFETTSTGATLTGSLTVNGHVVPNSNNSWDLGTSSVRWRNVYTNDLHLSNEGSSNDVDSTWGDWTIQEGESDLFLKNNRSGKKYKFNLTEVS